MRKPMRKIKENFDREFDNHPSQDCALIENLDGFPSKQAKSRNYITPLN